METKLQKIYLTFYSLLIAQDLAISISNLFNNLSEGICRIKCKYKYCNCFLEYTSFEDDLIEYKCLSCSKG